MHRHDRSALEGVDNDRVHQLVHDRQAEPPPSLADDRAMVSNRERDVSRNRYRVNLDAKMRYEAQSDQEVRQLLNLLEPPTSKRPADFRRRRDRLTAASQSSG
jgi:hypothetical protein